ncbi:MAG: AlpA family phage regulatory protein [Oligoflexales bacterium]|nr:AlpA family phage regulatory protein [Oligoflexales bacterium]
MAIFQAQFTHSIIPDIGYLRLKQILGNPRSNPPIPPLIPIGKSTWWAGIKTGKYPKPMKLGPRTSVWRVEDIRHLIEKFAT